MAESAKPNSGGSKVQNGYISGNEKVHEQGLRRNVRTQTEYHVIKLMGTIVAVIIYSAVNSCSDII